MKETKTIWKKYAWLVLPLLALPIAWALSTTTSVQFNVASVVAYTLTLPGESPVSATTGGAATAAIEFNSTTGTDTDVNARVVGSGSAQVNGTPIFQFDNTGTVNLNLSVQLGTALPSCMNLTGAATYAGAGSGLVISNTANVTVVNNFTSAAAVQSWYMMSDFTACVASDTTTKTLRSYGVQS